MPRKRHTAEEIVAKLRQVDVLTAQGRPVAEAVRAIGVTGVTYARRLARRGDLLLPPGGADRHRRMAAAPRHPPPPFRARLQGASSPGGPMAGSTGHPRRGPEAGHALTSNPDHPMGAGHPIDRGSAEEQGSRRQPSPSGGCRVSRNLGIARRSGTWLIAAGCCIAAASLLTGPTLAAARGRFLQRSRQHPRHPRPPHAPRAGRAADRGAAHLHGARHAEAVSILLRYRSFSSTPGAIR
jgi:hypothetical protein